MSLFGKKKFGLVEALVVVEKKPDITPDGAKTGAAFVEALGLPVTVVAEVETKIAELEDSVKGMEEGVKSAKTELNVAPVIAEGAIGTLKAELKKLVEAIKNVVLGKVGRIEDARDFRIGELKQKIDDVRYYAGLKSDRVQIKGEKKVAKIERTINDKIAEVEAQLKSDLADLKIRITDLETETKLAKAEISTLTKIKTLFV